MKSLSKSVVSEYPFIPEAKADVLPFDVEERYPLKFVKCPKKTSAVYVMTCDVSRKRYIGSTTCLKTRLIRHRSKLKHRIHENRILQEEYDTYGVGAFTFAVLEFCATDPNTLLDRELYWVATLKPECNIYPPRKSGSFGKKLSYEEKAKISAFMQSRPDLHVKAVPRKKTFGEKDHLRKLGKVRGNNRSGKEMPISTKNVISSCRKAYFERRRARARKAIEFFVPEVSSLEDVSLIVGAALRRMRVSRGITTEKFPTLSGRTVIDTERANKKLMVPPMKKYAKAFGLTFKEFFQELAVEIRSVLRESVT